MMPAMEDYISKTIKAYDDTRTYEEGTRLVVPAVELDEFLKMLEPDAKILDAGCAYGRDAQYIFSKGYHTVQGIDLSAPFIERARHLVPEVEFAVRDVRDTGFLDASFDGIWSNATLLHLNDEDISRALKEFYRILKPNGILAVSFKKGEGTQQLVDNFSSKSERFFNFKTHETFLELLEAAGFQERAWHYLNERERYGEDKRDLDWLYSFSQKAA
jgi:SAM-dependent methyltransferase